MGRRNAPRVAAFPKYLVTGIPVKPYADTRTILVPDPEDQTTIVSCVGFQSYEDAVLALLKH